MDVGALILILAQKTRNRRFALSTPRTMSFLLTLVESHIIAPVALLWGLILVVMFDFLLLNNGPFGVAHERVMRIGYRIFSDFDIALPIFFHDGAEFPTTQIFIDIVGPLEVFLTVRVFCFQQIFKVRALYVGRLFRNFFSLLGSFHRLIWILKSVPILKIRFSIAQPS